jgi:hypothetical protein
MLMVITKYYEKKFQAKIFFLADEFDKIIDSEVFPAKEQSKLM